MMVVAGLVVGYLLLSLLATLILISAFVAGKRFDTLSTRSSDFVPQNNFVEVRDEVNATAAIAADTAASAKKNAEATVVQGKLNQIMPQFIRQVAE